MIWPQDVGSKPFIVLLREFPLPGRDCPPGDGNSFFVSAGTGQEAGLWLRFYYFRKRVNDFTTFGKTRK